MSDLTETAGEENGSPIFLENYDTNAQFPSPIEEPKDMKADKSSSALASPQIMKECDDKELTITHAEIQTDLSLPFHLPKEVQNVLNAYIVMAEVSDSESLTSEAKLIDSSGSEHLQQNPFFNYDLPSPPLTDEDLKILYESLSSSERLDADLFNSALQDQRILSPPLSDVESKLMTPEDLEVAEIIMNNAGMEG